MCVSGMAGEGKNECSIIMKLMPNFSYLYNFYSLRPELFGHFLGDSLANPPFWGDPGGLAVIICEFYTRDVAD